MSLDLLITGGAGFIGSNFIRYLLKHTTNRITNIDALTYAGNPDNIKNFTTSENYRFFKIDISQTEELNQVFDRSYDVIIHFAAESHVDRSIKNAKAFIETNINGTHALLGKVLEGKVRKMVQISTDEVYGSLKKMDAAFTEYHCLSPNNPYSASKAGADLLVRSFFQTYKLPIIITRCSNNYGPYQHPEKFIPKIIYHALTNKKIPLYGDGLNIRDWLHVEDHCRAIYMVVKHGQAGEVYNIGGNNEMTNIDVIRTILHDLGKGENLISYVPDRKGHDRRYAIDSTKIKKELGWQPATSFSEGMKQTIDWYIKNEKWIESALRRSDLL
ncbi:dTDP-glucose 4,6-dehydratase [Halalkalibacter alkalisediminis]|uniref:dTDP-glucose 4,6-dehydratase n=1 Tax=Halalkalibacter alkalisediminis TaxID=935616 RepID=A0ABV6NPD2_9BACI|nr:dTDP-glucose 4,6-dehydratase [Halalkalibacter alkalisediminis]